MRGTLFRSLTPRCSPSGQRRSGAGLLISENAHPPRAPLDRLTDALQIAGDPQAWPVLLRRIEYAQAFWDALLRPGGKSGGRASILRQDSRLTGLDRDSIRGIEYDAEGRLSGKI